MSFIAACWAGALLRGHFIGKKLQEPQEILGCPMGPESGVPTVGHTVPALEQGWVGALAGSVRKSLHDWEVSLLFACGQGIGQRLAVGRTGDTAFDMSSSSPSVVTMESHRL